MISRTSRRRLRALLSTALGLSLLAPVTAAAAQASAATTWPTAASSASAAAAAYGPRVSGGCTDTGAKRVQVIYVVSGEPDIPDRYDEYVGQFRAGLKEVDDIFVASARVNGGGSRQVRWVRDADCQPTIAHAVVPPSTDANGKTHKVYGTLADTKLAMEAAGWQINDPNRKYILLVDYPGASWEDPICGVTSGNDGDTQAGQANDNNSHSWSRIDPVCWAGTWDADNDQYHSVIAHELVHGLGAVLPGAPHATKSGHCTDNADLMCLGVPTGYDADGYVTGYDAQMMYPAPCADTFENLLDCGGDDYFNTKPTAGSWLAGHWNVANSSFLYIPEAPTVTPSTTMGDMVPGLPLHLTASASVPSGQGWRLSYGIAQATPANTFCTFGGQYTQTRTSDAADPLHATLLCPATAATAKVTTTLTQQDGQYSVATTSLAANGALRDAQVALTGATSADASNKVNLSARVLDTATGQGIYGVPVHFRSQDGLTALGEGTTNADGFTTATVTTGTAMTVRADMDPTGLWRAATDSTAIAVQAPTALSLDPVARPVSPGTRVSLHGRLTDAAGAGLAARPVTLWQHAAAGAPWAQAAETVTDTDGNLTYPVTVASSTTYQVRYAGASDAQASTSTALTVSTLTETQLAATPARATVPAGQPVVFSASLTAAGAPAAGQTLELGRVTGTSWLKVASAVTGADGAAALTASPTSDGTYQVRFAGTATLLSSTSADLVVTVQRPVSLTVTAPPSVPRGRAVTISGKLTSGSTAVVGRTVELWRTDPGDEEKVSTAVSLADGAVTLDVTADGTHTYQLRAPADDSYAFAESPEITVHAIRATTAAITAPARAAYAGKVTVTGTLRWAGTTAGVPGQPVELWAAVTGQPFAEVATATTSNTGTASFTLTPTATTSYQLRFTGTADKGSATSSTAVLAITRATTASVAAPTRATYATKAAVTGTLRWAGATAGVAGQPVELWAAATGKPFVRIASATTGSTGAVTFTVTSTATTSYQLRYPGSSAGAYLAGPSASSTTTLTSVRGVTGHASASTAKLSYGSSLRVTGFLTWAGTTTRLTGQPVELWGYATSKWARLATGNTSATGYALFSVHPTYNTTYQLRYAGNREVGTVNTAAATGTTATVHVTAKVAFKTPTTVRSTSTYTVTGSITPAVPGRSVSLQVNGRTVTKVGTDRYGHYSARIKFPRGRPTARAYLYSSSYNDGAYSSTYQLHAQ